MTVIRVDRRTIRGQRNDAAIARLARGRSAWFRREIDLARQLVLLDRQGAYHFEGAASVVELARRLGYDGPRARQLLHLGYALEGVAELETALRDRQVTMSAGALIGQLYRDPERFVEADDDWLQRAKLSRYDDLRRAVRQRIASRRQQAVERQVVFFTALIGPQTADDLEACRTLASKRVGRWLDNGELVSTLALSYRLLHDSRIRARRARRMPHTSTLLQKRGVPEEVAGAILSRSDGICEVGDCDHPIAERCHVEPHRDGSAREELDLFGACRRHHKAYDAGLLELASWTSDGLPVFRVKATGELLSPKPRPEKREVLERPAWLWQAVARTPPRPPAPERRAAGAKASGHVAGDPREAPPDIVRDRASEWGWPPGRQRRGGRGATAQGASRTKHTTRTRTARHAAGGGRRARARRKHRSRKARRHIPGQPRSPPDPPGHA